MFYQLFVEVLNRISADSTRVSSFMDDIAEFCVCRNNNNGEVEYQLIEQADTLTEELISDNIGNAREVALIAMKMIEEVSDYRIIIACLINENEDYARKHNLRSWNSEFIDKWFKGVEPLLLDSKMVAPLKYGGAVVKLAKQLHKLIRLVRISTMETEVKKEIKKEIRKTGIEYIPVAKKYRVLEDELLIITDHLEYYLR